MLRFKFIPKTYELRMAKFGVFHAGVQGKVSGLLVESGRSVREWTVLLKGDGAGRKWTVSIIEWLAGKVDAQAFGDRPLSSLFDQPRTLKTIQFLFLWTVHFGRPSTLCPMIVNFPPRPSTFTSTHPLT